MIKLIITNDTIFKLKPADSASLANDQKLFIPQGSRFVLGKVEDAENNHYRVTFNASFGSAVKTDKIWYVYKGHGTVVKPSENLATVKTQGGPLNLRNSPAVKPDNLLYQINDGTQVELLDFEYNQGLWWFGRPTKDPQAVYGWMAGEYLQLID